MSKFNVEVTFDLTTSIEFDGRIYFDEGDTEDFSDNSYFQSEDITSSGGEITFVVEADTEDDAYEAARNLVDDGNEHEDSSGITWLVDSVNIDVEKIEEPMTLERATEILARLVSDSADEEAEEAIAFVLAHIRTLTTKVAEVEAKLAEAQKDLAEVKALVETAKPAFGSDEGGFTRV